MLGVLGVLHGRLLVLTCQPVRWPDNGRKGTKSCRDAANIWSREPADFEETGSLRDSSFLVGLPGLDVIPFELYS